MTPEQSSVWSMSGEELLSAARDLVKRSQNVEADLLVHLGEIDERRLFLGCSYPSMFAFCVGELGFSEDAAYNRIHVARAGRHLPAIIDAIRAGHHHLWGMRLLVPHLNEANHCALIEQTADKSKREIDELIATLAPRPPVATVIRSVPAQLTADGSMIAPAPMSAPPPGWTSLSPDPNARLLVDAPASLPPPQRIGPAVVPLSAQTYKIQFTAGRAFRDSLHEAQDLMRHRVPDGNLETILGAALELLIEQVKKEKFAVGRKAKAGGGAPPSQSSNGSEGPAGNTPAAAGANNHGPHPDLVGGGDGEAASRHIPNEIKRAVYERDGGRCTFVDDRGKRCTATGGLEYEHDDGFACTGKHEVERIRLLCRAHNQYEAERRYGRAFMESARKSHGVPPTCSGTSPPRQPEG